MLGGARDSEVLASHLHAGLAAVPTELVIGPAQARITAHFAQLEASSRKAVLDAFDSNRYKKLRTALGDHQDAVIAQAAARDIGIHAHLAGENAFSFGLLEERAHHQALASEDRAYRAWRRARRKASWLPKS